MSSLAIAMVNRASSVQGVTVLLTSSGSEDPVPLLVNYTAKHSTYSVAGIWHSVPGEQWTKLSKGQGQGGRVKPRLFSRIGTDNAKNRVKREPANVKAMMKQRMGPEGSAHWL